MKREKFLDKCFDFIKQDLVTRNETPTSDVIVFGALFTFKVKTPESKRAKTVTYSAAVNVLKGYRPIKL